MSLNTCRAQNTMADRQARASDLAKRIYVRLPNVRARKVKQQKHRTEHVHGCSAVST